LRKTTSRITITRSRIADDLQLMIKESSELVRKVRAAKRIIV